MQLSCAIEQNADFVAATATERNIGI